MNVSGVNMYLKAGFVLDRMLVVPELDGTYDLTVACLSIPVAGVMATVLDPLM